MIGKFRESFLKGQNLSWRYHAEKTSIQTKLVAKCANNAYLGRKQKPNCTAYKTQ
jgi:hypothetical protein